MRRRHRRTLSWRLSPEEFAELSVPEQQHIHEEHEHVEESFAATLPKLRELEAEAGARIERLQHVTSAVATQHLVAELSARYASHERVADCIRHLQRDILAHADVVRGKESDAEMGVREPRPVHLLCPPACLPASSHRVQVSPAPPERQAGGRAEPESGAIPAAPPAEIRRS
jgi:hypothetical protein